MHPNPKRPNGHSHSAFHPTPRPGGLLPEISKRHYTLEERTELARKTPAKMPAGIEAVKRIELIRAMGESHDLKFEPTLLKVLEDRYEMKDVQEAAIRAMGTLKPKGSARAVEAFLAKSGKGMETMRMASAWALGEIREVESARALQEHLLRDPYWAVRIESAYSLVKILGKGAVPVLRDALRKKIAREREFRQGRIKVKHAPHEEVADTIRHLLSELRQK